MIAESSLSFEVCRQAPYTLPRRCRIAYFVLCVMGLTGAEAAEAGRGIPAGTSTYVFVAAESMVIESDSEQAYLFEGQFELAVDIEARSAAFSQADLRVTEDPNSTAPDLNAVFSLTTLSGFVVDDTTIEFRGVVATGRSIALALTFDGDAVRLTGFETTTRTRLGSSERHELEALAWRQYGGEITIPEGRSAYVFLPDQSMLLQVGGIAGIYQTDFLEGRFELEVDLEAGTGSFISIDANGVAGSPPSYGFDPNAVFDHVFKVTEWVGTVVNESTIYFGEETPENSCTDVVVTLVFDDDMVRFVADEVAPRCFDWLYSHIGAVAQREYGGGTGEPNCPYLIQTPEQFNAIGAEPNDWDKHLKLMADIDLGVYAGDEFNIIGTDVNAPFTGVFDGNDHVISNFRYALTDTEEIGYWGPDSENVGLFGVVDDPNAAIRNLVLETPKICASQTMAVGALVGYLRHGELTGCRVKGGEIWALILGGCLVGRSNGTVTSCRADGGNVTGNSTLGGLVGSNSGTIAACHASTNVAGFVSLGGLVGANGGDITACYAAGGTVSGVSTLGGLVGHSDRAITDCYATDTVSGTTIVGGLVGHSGGAIRRCYAAGAVSGRENVGGLLGRGFQGDGTGCFWDIETTGQSTSAAGLGRTTAQMQIASMFRMMGWDFAGETQNGTDDIWSMPPGQDYPRLWWEEITTDVTE